MSTTDRIVCEVEDGEALRSLVQPFAHLSGLAYTIFPFADRVPQDRDPRQPGCRVLGAFMPGIRRLSPGRTTGPLPGAESSGERRDE